MRRATLTLGGSPRDVPDGRRFVAERLRRWGLASVADEVELAAGELVANALLHAGPPAEMELTAADGRVRVAVRDGSRLLPLLPRADPGAMTGRGLALVSALADRLGAEPSGDGKLVWAEFTEDSVARATPGTTDRAALLAGSDEPPRDGPPRFTVTLGDVPTDLLLAAKSHVDSLVREFMLASRGEASGMSAAVPAHLAALVQGVVDEFAEARLVIKRQALRAAEKGEPRTRLALTLPAEAAAAGERYLAALDQADAYGRAARLLTLEAPPQHRVFRRWYVESLVTGLRRAAAGEPPQPAPTFESYLLAEVDRLAASARASDRAARLQGVTAALSGRLTADEVGGHVVEEAMVSLGAHRGSVVVLDEDGRARVVAQLGYPADLLDRLRDVGDRTVLPIREVLASGRAQWVESREERDRRYPDLRRLEPDAIASCALPLVAGGRTLGVLRLSFPQPRLFDDEERRFLAALAAITAQAIDRASIAEEADPGQQPNPDMSVDIASWGLSDVVACAAGLRSVTAGATTMEEAAGRIVRYLRQVFTDAATGRSSLVLARLFKTERWSNLPADLQAFAAARLPDGTPVADLRCLTLLGTDGDLPEWCDRHRSTEHRAVPLPSVEAVQRAPMVAALVSDLGVGVDALVSGTVLPAERSDFDVFHVEIAAGSDRVPAQDFVDRHGVRSVLGFGGVLPTGDVFAVVLFARTTVTAAAATLFRTIAVSAKLALLPFVGAPVFAGQSPRPAEPLGTAAARISALEQMLLVHESTVGRQAAELEASLRRLQRQDHRLRREAELIETLRSVGETLAAELDLDRVVQQATDAIVELTGAEFGAFFYNVVDVSGESYVLYTLSGAPREAFERFPMPRNTPVFGPTFRAEGVVRSADIVQDPRYGHVEPYRGMPPGHLPVHSYLAAPVVSLTGEVHGGLFLGHREVGVFDERAERLAVGIARQTAAALDNARLYQRTRETALELQRALLPRILPRVAGLQLAHRYLPGLTGVEVGGDWYDVIPLADGRAALVIGDVMGRGVRAAATMGQLRTAVRALARLELAPSAVLENLNDLVLDLTEEQIVTCVYAVYDPAAAVLRLANAGHPPPVVQRPGREAELVHDQLGPPLGIPGAAFAERVVELPAGSSVLLYTDGLVETRTRPADDGIAQLRALVSGSTATPDELCDEVLSTLTGESDHDDDVALLLAAVPPAT